MFNILNGITDFLFLCSLIWCVGMMFILEPRVSLEAASLSLGIEARSVYIPPSPDPISSFAIYGIYWVWLLLTFLYIKYYIYIYLKFICKYI
ncbi:hypothetical protein Hanom_Chr04g00364161 [Helianthus anomalus]